MQIKDLLGEEYLRRFRIFHEVTLFPPNWEALRLGRCPLCNKLLTFPVKNRKVAICTSPKHKGFTISKKKFDEIVGNVV